MKCYLNNHLLKLVLLALLVGFAIGQSGSDSGVGVRAQHSTDSGLMAEAKALSDEVVPQKGFKTKIVLGDAVQKMVSDGIIDKSKMEAKHKNDKLSKADWELLSRPSHTPLTI